MAELGSPILGGIESARGVMSPGITRSAAEDRMVMTSLVGGLSIRLDRITRDLADTTDVVERIRASIDQNTFLERQKEALEQERERRLAEQQLREGQESLIERKIESAAVAPAQKEAIKAQSSLNNLMGLFAGLLGGWLTVKVFSNFQNIQKFTLEKLGDTKEFIQGAFANIGDLFKNIGTSFSNLFTNIGRIDNILKNSFNDDLFKGGFTFLKNVFENALGLLNPSNFLGIGGDTTRTGTSTSTSASGTDTSLSLSLGTSPLSMDISGGTSLSAYNFNLNPENVFGATSGVAETLGTQATQQSTNLTDVGFNLGSILQNNYSEMFKDSTRMFSGLSLSAPENQTPMSGAGPVPLQVAPFRPESVERAEGLGPESKPQTNVVVSAAPSPQVSVVPPSLNRDGNSLPNISSSNPDNFYVYYSMVNYNVVI